MILELAIAIPLSGLYYKGIIGPKIIGLILSTFYWLPKYLFMTWFLEWLFPSILTRNKNMTKNQIALTFDDVPYGSHQELIDILDAYQIKATFFVISGYVTDESKQILIKAVQKGHQLGNHGKTNSAHARLSESALADEIDSCDELISDIYTKAEVKLPNLMAYRPSCGLFTNKMLRMVHTKGYVLSLGSVYPNDPVIRSSWINYYYLINHIEKGDIVILHDRKWTIPMLDKLLPWLRHNKYESVTLNDMFS